MRIKSDIRPFHSADTLTVSALSPTAILLLACANVCASLGSMPETIFSFTF